MGISVVGAQAESGSNDFTLNIGTSGNTTFALDKTYPSGRYEVDFINNDSTYDIYAVTAAGSYVGYTNSTSIDITQDFRTIVVLGAANNEKITFTFSGPIATAGTKGDVVGAAAFLTEVVTAALPNIDDTTVVNGGNFATNVAISFIGQDTNETNAKSVVRSSSTQLVVTRPDSFSPAQSPYTLKALNPGIPAPTGSNSHLLTNAVTAGTSPAWVTGTTIYYNVGGATNITLVAEDTEASDVDYSITSGTLPTGLSLNSETGVISGTFSGSASEGDVTSITVRATDAGGNYVDRTFSLTANTAPTWTTSAGALTSSSANSAYSFQLVASTGTAGGALTYSLQSGQLPNGLTLSSSGLISGTNTETVAQTDTFTVRVSDEQGLFADREFSITTTVTIWKDGQTFIETNYWSQTASYDNTTRMTTAPFGNDGPSYVTTDGLTWTQGFSPRTGATGHSSARMTETSNGKIVSADEGNGLGYSGAVVSSTNGTSWSNRSFPYSGKPYAPVALGNGVVFGGSESNKYRLNSDNTWGSSANGNATWTVYSGYNTARDRALIIAESTSGFHFVSETFSVFNDRNFPATVRNDAVHISNGVISRWIVPNSMTSNTVYTSDLAEPTTWTTRSPSIGTPVPRAVASSGTKVLLLNTANEVYATADGITWTKQAGTIPSSKLGAYSNIKFFKNRWYLGADDGTVLYANDSDIVI